MDKHHASAATEFSRIVPVDRLEQGEVDEAIAAREAERQALAQRFGLLALDSLSAQVSLRRIGHGPAVRVEGRLTAEVTQSCVVSLEPVASHIEENFSLLFAPEGRSGATAALEGGHDIEAEEWPEPIIEGRIDIGEAVAQQLALALDPYPRRAGVRLEDVIGKQEAKAEERSASPFAVLARLTRRDS